MPFPLRHRNFICSLRDDLAVGTINVWFPTEGTKQVEPVPPKKELEVETVRVEERLSPRIEQGIAIIRSLPQGSTWPHFKSGGHTWSMVPPDLCVQVHGTLEKLCHEATDLCGAGYTLQRLTLEAVEKLQKCYVCKGTRKTPNCSMHPGSRHEMLNESTKEMERHWTCCGLIEVPNRKSKRKSGGCYPLKEHDLEDLEALAANFEFLETPLPVAGSSKRKAVVLDCEMGGSHFNRNELIWVSVVDFFTGETLIHEFVKPSTEILDWRTQFSGVSGSRASSLEAENKFLDGWQQARQQLLDLIDSETIIIGHALHNDLYQLRLIHRRVIDTALTIPRITGKKHSVQSLSLELLNKVVQGSAHGHDCLEDTLSARELLIWCLRHPDEVWERAVHSQRQLADVNAEAASKITTVSTVKQETSVGHVLPSDQWTPEQRMLLEQLLATGLKTSDIIAECSRLDHVGPG